MCIRINKNVSSTFVINTTDTAKRDLDGHSRPSVAERPVQPSSSIVSNDRSSSASSVPSRSWQDIYYKTCRRYRRLVLVQGRHLSLVGDVVHETLRLTASNNASFNTSETNSIQPSCINLRAHQRKNKFALHG